MNEQNTAKKLVDLERKVQNLEKEVSQLRRGVGVVERRLIASRTEIQRAKELARTATSTLAALRRKLGV